MSDEFTPYPKNPLIQQFFANIGRTDTIGSGVRNLYKYTPIYSDGGKPELIINENRNLEDIERPKRKSTNKKVETA